MIIISVQYTYYKILYYIYFRLYFLFYLRKIIMIKCKINHYYVFNRHMSINNRMRFKRKLVKNIFFQI